MARSLTERQQRFLDVLFDDAGGDVVAAKKLAGYGDNSSTTAIVEALKDEIKEYDDYLQGNIFGIIISEKYKKVTIPYYQNIADKICNSDWEEIDSCYGFIGEDYAIQEHDSWVKHFEGEE